MKKIFIAIFVLSLSVTTSYADSMDKALDASTRALNAGTVYGGVNTAAGVANTVSNVKTNASIRRNIDTQTKLLKQQAALQGIDITDAKDIQDEHMKQYFQSRYYLIAAKRQAKTNQEILETMDNNRRYLCSPKGTRIKEKEGKRKFWTLIQKSAIIIKTYAIIDL